MLIVKTQNGGRHRRWKRLLLVVVVLMLGGAAAYVTWQRMTRVVAFEAVPSNSAFVIDVEHDGAPLLPSSFPYLSELQSLALVQDLLVEWRAVRRWVFDWSHGQVRQSIIAAQIGASNTLNYIYLFDGLPSRWSLVHELSLAQVSHERQAFGREDFYRVRLDDAGKPWYVAQKGSLLIVAPTAELLEKSLRQLATQETSLVRDRKLRRMRSLSAANARVSLYVNMEYVPVFASFYSSKAGQPQLEALRRVASWAGLDVTLHPKHISLSGYLTPAPDNHLLKALRSQQLPDKTRIASVLPDHTAAMTYVGFDDVQQFVRDLPLGQEDAHFQDYFVPWLGNEVAYVVTEPLQGQVKAHQLAFFHAADEDKATALLAEYADTVGRLASYPYLNFTIHQLLAYDVLRPIFGESLNPIQRPYYALVPGYVIFANDRRALESVLDRYTFGQTLGTDVNYLKFVEDLSSTSNCYLYINTANSLHLLSALLDPSYDKALIQQFEALQRLTPIGIQLTPYKDLFFVSANVRYNKKGKQKNMVLWKSDLYADAATRPFVVRNHQNNAKEVLIQDVAHTLYLLDEEGEEQWHRVLDGRIQSAVRQVDLFKNGNLQYVFNTTRSLYVIDRTGQYVAPYPIALPDTITGSVAVLNYDNQRRYRFFVACADSTLYGFEGNGNALEGWSPMRDVGRVEQPLQYLSHKGKDYLAVLNTAGQLRVWARDGSLRMPPLSLATKGRAWLATERSPYVRWRVLDASGQGFWVNLAGESFQRQADGLADGMLTSVVGVSRADSVHWVAATASGWASIGMDHKGRYGVMQRVELGYEARDLALQRLDGDWYVSTQHGAEVTLHRLHTGALYPDFPLGGTTPLLIADLYGDSTEVLLVGQQQSVYVYKLKRLLEQLEQPEQ